MDDLSDNFDLLDYDIIPKYTDNKDNNQLSDIIDEQSLTDREIWNDIVNKSDEHIRQVEQYIESKSNINDAPGSMLISIKDSQKNPELKYLNEHVFPILLPILEKTLLKAIRMKSLERQKSLFNGIDYMAEILWNTNSKYPERAEKNELIFLMDWVLVWLQDKPRPFFPLSWVWTREQATIKMQSYMRGHFVRKTRDVQEMRQFWKNVRHETMEVKWLDEQILAIP